MKKFLNISLLALFALSSFSLTSCLHEVEEVFDEDAVIRMNNAMAEYEDILTSNGGKWLFEYYANGSEPGYNYVLTFHKDGTVDMAGHNKWIQYIKTKNWTSAYGTMRSMWEVIGDNGLVLTFNSYNDYFHLFSTPEAVPTQGGTMTQGGASTAGKGHEGDYEFNLMKFSGDTIYMTGKKYNLHMILTRLPESTNDSTYLNQVATYNSTMFTSKLNNVYIVLPDGKRWIVESAATGYMTIYPEGEDKITTSESHNFIITDYGMSFRDPLVLEGNTPGESYRIQRFARQADGTALCVEDNKTLITADVLTDCLGKYSWNCASPKKDFGGTYLDLQTQISKESSKKAGTTLKSAQISYIDSLSTYALTLFFSKQSSNFPARYLFTMTPSGDSQVKLTFTGTSDYGEIYKGFCPTIESLIEALGATMFNLSSSSLLAPETVTMSESGNPENFIIWKITLNPT